MLGTGLGMSSIIEGVECEEDLANTCEDGCNRSQGYLFGKAIPSGHLEDFIARIYVGSSPSEIDL